MRPVILYLMLPLFTFMTLAPHTKAEEFSAVYKDDSGYYSLVESERFNNTLMGIYAYPITECRPYINVISLRKDKAYDDEETGSFESTSQIRIDNGRVHTNDVYIKGEFGDYAGFNWRMVVAMPLTDSQLAELITGHFLYSRSGPDDDEPDKFSLSGSSRALNEVVRKCKKGTTDEWSNTSEPVKGVGDEWSL